MFKDKLKGFAMGVLACSITAGVVAFAKTGTETIDAIYNNIKIYVDGIKIEPKDSEGAAVEPFIYNGTTYLPVRAVGEAVGKKVTWDGSTQSVYLGAVPGQTQNWMDVCKPYEYKNGTEYTEENSKTFTMSGVKYINGFTIDPRGGGFALFNLDGKYSSLSFKVGHVDGEAQWDTEMNIYLDDKLAQTIPLAHDSIAKTVTVPLNGALHMKIELTSGHHGYPPYYGFAEGVFN